MRFIGTLTVVQEKYGPLFLETQSDSSKIGCVRRMNFAWAISTTIDFKARSRNFHAHAFNFKDGLAFSAEEPVSG
jgi:hypothetical protein